MKYRVLLAGKNRAIVDDFFRTMDDRFECLTTSNRSKDIANHMMWFKPHAFVYCFASESKDDIIRLAEAMEEVPKEYQKIVLIGDPEHCEVFNRRRGDMVQMELHRPITANSIRDKLIKYFEKNKIGVEKEEESDLEQLVAIAKSIDEKTTVEERGAVEKKAQSSVADAAAAILNKQKAALDIAALTRAVQTKTVEEKQLQAAPAEAAPMEEASRGQALPDLSSLPTEIVEMKHVLVIDDDLMMLRLVKSELKDRYNVATAVSGKVGLKFLERRSTDLILLDYEMPEENGAEVLEKLRANPMTRNIPVVFLTGMNNREKIKQLVAMKPQGYLLKPIKCEQLMATIRQLIG